MPKKSNGSNGSQTETSESALAAVLKERAANPLSAAELKKAQETASKRWKAARTARNEKEEAFNKARQEERDATRAMVLAFGDTHLVMGSDTYEPASRSGELYYKKVPPKNTASI